MFNAEGEIPILVKAPHQGLAFSSVSLTTEEADLCQVLGWPLQ